MPRTLAERQASARKAWVTIRAKRAGLATASTASPTVRRQVAEYLAMVDLALLQLLAAEQRTVDKWASHPGHAGWTRFDDDQSVQLSGGCIGGGIARQQLKFALARIARIEHVLDVRGIDREVTDGFRFDELHTVDPERDGLQDETGDTTFSSEAVA